MTFDVSRRSLLGMGLLGGGSIFGKFLPNKALAQKPKERNNHFTNSAVHGGSTTVGDVDNDRNGFSPRDILTDCQTRWCSWNVRSDARRRSSLRF